MGKELHPKAEWDRFHEAHPELNKRCKKCRDKILSQVNPLDYCFKCVNKILKKNEIQKELSARKTNFN